MTLRLRFYVFHNQTHTNIVVSDRKLGLFSNFQMALALSKWPRIDQKCCMVVSRILIFNIRLVLDNLLIYLCNLLLAI
jgi:hypothetical protein